MCRIAVFATKNWDLISKVIDAIVKASKYDFIADKEYAFRSHEDGWGYSIAVFKGWWHTITYKTRTPVWLDNLTPLRKVIEGADIVLGLIHTRKASTGMPINAYSAHPYTVSVKQGCILHVAQNGGIKKEEGAKLLRGRYELELEKVTDTFIYTLLLAEYYDTLTGDPPERLLNALVSLHKQLDKTRIRGRCLNTTVLLEGPENLYAVAGVRAYYQEKEYYQLYEHKEEFLMVSSTVAEVFPEELKKINRNIVKVAYIEKGEIMKLVHEIPLATRAC